MKTLILPGLSVHNKDWADEVAMNLGKDAFVHNWLHWKKGKSNLSLKEELISIAKKIDKEKVNIIAKSVGTMVVMHLLKELPNQIEKIILCGIPSVSDERKNLFSTSLSAFKPKNIIVFQNTKDPLASFSEVKKFMKEVNLKIKVIEKERSDHNYPYFEDFKNYLIS
jgi:predicted alpha/beta hydrolase family esterase